MSVLRKINASDAELVSSRMNLSIEEAKSLIDEWNTGRFNGNYFEMFAVSINNTVVGLFSIYEHSKSIVSIGPEIFEEYRQNGFAKKAMAEIMRIAKEKKYSIILQQVRTDNIASIRFHESLGFEKDNSIYKNRKGNDIFLYLKTI